MNTDAPTATAANPILGPTVPPWEISAELLPVVEELGMVENCRQLAEEGWTIIENAADPDFFARLRRTILDSEGQYRLLRHEPIFAEAAINPKVMALAEFSVGRGCLLGSLISSIRSKGDPQASVHSDQAFFPSPFPQHNMMLTACWACDEFTQAGGATLVIPGTHRHLRPPTDEESAAAEGAIAARCPAGAIAVWDGRVWHGNWPRTLEGQRVVLHATYYRLLMRPADDYSDIADVLIERYGPRMSQLLGEDDFLYKKSFDYVGDYETFARTLANARS